MGSSHGTVVPKRPPRALILTDLPPQEADAEIDWSRWYVTDEEDMGSSIEQQAIVTLLLACLAQWSTEKGWDALLIGQDVFFAWIPREPLVRVSPDVFVVDKPPDPPPSSIQTWLPGHKPPRFALEVVSQDKTKDHEDAPLRYAQLGCTELVVFDPAAPSGRRPDRQPLTVYRRQEDGAFARVYAGAGPAPSRELDAWLVVRPEHDRPRLRIARNAEGMDIVLTGDEKAVIEAAGRRKAEAEIATLKAELDRLKNGGR